MGRINKCLEGVNDLLTNYPDIAKEANGWDPSKISQFSKSKLSWICPKGHKPYEMSVCNRTSRGSICPACRASMQGANKCVEGVNDLLSKYPDIAKEANGWDPSKISQFSKSKLSWICPKGHKPYKMTVSNRTKHNQGCQICGGQRVINIKNKTDIDEINELASTYPLIAKEANGWDPKLFSYGSGQKLSWICPVGHEPYEMEIADRTLRGSKCPICSNRKVLAGFNDLKTTYPELAREAYKWDPSKFTYGHESEKKWKCSSCSWIWETSINNRSQGRGCPKCAEYGFNSSKNAWMYLMNREDEQQFGISNFIAQRVNYHKRYGWVLIDKVGPFSGESVLKVETALKSWLKKEIGTIDGTTENWDSRILEVSQLSELIEKAKIPKEIQFINLKNNDKKNQNK